MTLTGEIKMFIPIPIRLALGAAFVWYCFTNWDKAVFLIFLAYTFFKIVDSAR
jgi:hypothetical protein